MRKISLWLLLIFIPFLGFSQQLVNPNFALASHPMKVTNISHTSNETIINLSIENQIETGTFCADKNIFIQDVISGKKYPLQKSQGIPVCPSNYQFKYVGEILIFQLHFSKINSKTKYLTLVEDCNQYCFSIKGIVLDTDMNKTINLGYDYYAKGKLDFALEAFKMAIDQNPDYPFGLHYFNVIEIYAEKYDYTSAKKWYQKILSADFLDKEELIARLKKQSFYKQLL